MAIKDSEWVSAGAAAALFDSANLAALIWNVEDSTLRARAVNHSAERLIGKNDAETILAQVPAAVRETLLNAASSGVAHDLGVLSFEDRRFRTHAVPINSTDVALVLSDITDSVTHAALQAIPDMIFRLRKDGTHLDFIGPNNAPLIPPNVFIGKRLAEVLPGDIAAQIQAAIDRAITERKVATATYELDYGNDRRVFEARIAAIDEDEVVASVRDVTIHARQHEELARRVLMAEEDERREIAREIHDHTAQLVTALSLSIEVCRREVPEVVQHTREVETIVSELASQFHDLALNLRPPMLDEKGLVSALKTQIDRFAARTGLHIDMRAGALPRFERYLERTAFRITQEALTNAARAGAQNITLDLVLSEHVMQITIIDDGKGFDPENVDLSRSSGLSSMRERALLAGGNIRFSSTSIGGASVYVTLPIP